MEGVTWSALVKEGFEIDQLFEAALPMPVWAVDLEIEREREITAAESAILNILASDGADVAQLTKLLGLRSDTRLAERVLVNLLSLGAIESAGDAFALTGLGTAWAREGTAESRERVTVEVRLDPVLDAFEWVDSERPVFSTATTWTIDLPHVDSDEILRRKAEIGDLVRQDGIPDDDEHSPDERRPPVDLVSLAVVGRRTHWRSVRLESLKHQTRAERPLVGYLGDAENPPLTRLLASHALSSDNRRIVNRP